MPLYDFLCSCGNTEERIARPDQREIPCHFCGGTMKRQFHSRFGISMGVGAYGYYDETLGCHISTNAQKRRVMQEQGVSEKFGKGWR